MRETPEQWLWMHRRWKTPARGEPRERPSASWCARPNWLGDVVLSLPALRDLRRELPARRASRCWPGRGWPPLYGAVAEVDAVRASAGVARRRGARCAGAFDVAVLLPNSFGSALPLRRRRDPRALGLRDGRPRAAADAAGRVLRPRFGAAARCTTIARCWRASDCASRPRPTRRLRARPSGAQAAARPARRRAPGSASTPAPSSAPPSAGCPSATRRWGTRWPRATGAPGSRSWAAPRSGRWARPSPRAMRHPARVLCGRDDAWRELVGRAVALAPAGHERLRAPCTWPPPWACPWSAVFGPTDWRETAPCRRARARCVREPVHCSPCRLRECPIDHRCMTARRRPTAWSARRTRAADAS